MTSNKQENPVRNQDYRIPAQDFLTNITEGQLKI